MAAKILLVLLPIIALSQAIYHYHPHQYHQYDLDMGEKVLRNTGVDTLGLTQVAQYADEQESALNKETRNKQENQNSSDDTEYAEMPGYYGYGHPAKLYKNSKKDQKSNTDNSNKFEVTNKNKNTKTLSSDANDKRAVEYDLANREAALDSGSVYGYPAYQNNCPLHYYKHPYYLGFRK